MAVLGATSLTGCNSIPQFIAGTADVGASASRTVFRMATSPVSWTKDTTAFDGTLRVVNGASLSPGGSSNFPVVFTSSVPLSVTLAQNSISLSVAQAAALSGPLGTGLDGSTSLQPNTFSITQMTAHSHLYNSGALSTLTPGATANHATTASTVTVFGSVGQSQGHVHAVESHDHSISGTIQQHSHTVPAPSGQHSHTVASTQNFNINYVDMIISIKN